MNRPAVFLDKDGTLVENIPYNVNPDRIRCAPGVDESLALIAEQGYALIVVSNQAGVARGIFPESALKGVEARLRDLFHQAGAALDAFYYCPHDPKGSELAYRVMCQCRKPFPGMFFRAAEDLDVDLSRSWMIGDILDDIEAGRRAGCKTVLVDNGSETEWIMAPERLPDHVARHFGEAARIVTSPASPPNPLSLQGRGGDDDLKHLSPLQGDLRVDQNFIDPAGPAKGVPREGRSPDVLATGGEAGEV